MKNSPHILLLIILSFSIISCGTPQTSPTSTGPDLLQMTPTPTSETAVKPPTPPTTPPSRCSSLAGEIEMQILVGPAEAVGLEPHSVGSIPFAVTTDRAPYLIHGGGFLDYYDVLAEEWGTYEVTLKLDTIITGNCVDTDNSGELTLEIELMGDQLVEVTAEGFHGEYPWAGTQTMSMNVPVEEGASVQGEGYILILHPVVE